MRKKDMPKNMQLFAEWKNPLYAEMAVDYDLPLAS